MTIYEVTYKKMGLMWTSLVSFQYLNKMEKDPSFEIISIR